MRREFLPYCRPVLGEAEVGAVVETMRRGWLTTGPLVARFECDFAAAASVKHAVALSSCTAGLHLALLALGVGPGDEVVLPSLSFVAGANCTRQVGATPVFCDVDAESLCLTPSTIAAVITPRTKAILTMHYAGRPASIGPILALARDRGIRVVEDAALAAGMLDDGDWSGTRADAAVYSFYATKNVTSAEGGMLVTNDDDLMDRVRVLALHGMDRDAWKRYERGGSWRYDIVATGYKYNMPDIAAAIGGEQLKRLDTLQARRSEIAAIYLKGIESIPGVTAAARGAMGKRDRHSWCMFPIEVDERTAGISRDDLVEALKVANIGTSVHYIPSHTFTAYRNAPHAPLPVTDAAWRRLISLPLFPSMLDDDAHDVIRALQACVRGSEVTVNTSR